MAAGKEGYDCDFVEDPPKRLECLICLQTVREPHVTSCCGHQFCRLCIEQVRLQRKPCSLCNEPSFTLFLHKGVEREVKALRVRCPQRELGCEWVGELGGLEQHVSPGTATGRGRGGAGEGCQYVEVECVYQCGERHQRRFILQHETELCTRRPLLEAPLASVTLKNLEEEQIRVKEQQRKQEEKHSEEMRKLSERLDTIFKAKKAENDSLREELLQAEEKLSKMQGKLEEVQGKLEEEQIKTRNLSSRLEEREEEARSLRQEFIKMKDHQERRGRLEKAVVEKCDYLESRLTPTLPFYFTIFNFEHLKEHDLRWFSDAFYSHPQGYKLMVEVHPGGSKYDTHMSVYVCLMRGEYDDTLKWPFLGSVTIQLFHCPTGIWKDVKVITFRDHHTKKGERHLKDYMRERPFNCIGNGGYGYDYFMSHSELETYVSDDKARFRIRKVELL